MCFTPCIEIHHDVTIVIPAQKKSIIFVANTRAPFRSIIQHYIVSMIFRLCCCYRCHSETSLSLSINLFCSILFLFLLLNFYKIFLYLIVSIRAFLFEILYHARCILYVHTHVLSRCLFSLFYPGLVCIRR